MPERTRVLLVEDDEEDYIITCDLLDAHPRAQFDVDWCSSFETALVTIAEARHDVYLIDYRLGKHNGIELVKEAFGENAHAPVLLLTGLSAYEIDLEATAAGVADFLVKGEMEPLELERAIRYAISHQRAVEELRLSQERYALAVRAVNDGIWDWDIATGGVFVSPRWNLLLGRPQEASLEAIEETMDLLHPDDRPGVEAALDAHMNGLTDQYSADARMLHADGSWRWMLVRGLAVGPPGARTRVAGSLSDITDQRLAEQRLHHDALHDSLTGLPNRTLFIDRLQHEMRRAVRDPTAGCAVLFIDIDRFKLVNDGLGHAAGDQLLAELARRVSAVLRPRDTLARLGGDEFAVLLEDVVSATMADEIARRIIADLTQAFTLEGREFFITASIGVCLTRGESAVAADLLRNADIAMYDAKGHGGGRVSFFDEGMHRQRVDRLTRENELRHALDDGLLELALQPIVRLETGELCGLEALCRWPKGWEPVGPLEFVAVAEETGLIGQLGLQVLRRALAVLAGLRRDGLVATDVTMSVNVSARQLEEGFPAQVADALAEAGLPPEALVLEVTESTLMHEPARLAKLVAGLCGTGVGLHLDDFGTGYSSLSALQALPVNALKIDRGFVATMETSDVIVRSTVTLAHSLGMRVIAEGIETTEQLERLRALGCEDGQGFGLSRPLDAATLRTRLAEWTGQVRPSTMPAPTVSFDASSTRMKEPVARLTA